ncbi:hypothetical protein I546_3309 [Mycobacterium kansasii 732]|nr:hypothetical protein I546_3309 [Mycobacterium kansasii 732]
MRRFGRFTVFSHRVKRAGALLETGEPVDRALRPTRSSQVVIDRCSRGQITRD